MRLLGALALLFMPVSAGELVDCGLVPGETYAIDREHLLRPDGTVLVGWQACEIPVGVRLTVAITEVAPPPPRVTIKVTPPCGQRWDASFETEKAIAYFTDRGVPATSIDVVTMSCGPTPVIDAEIGTSASSPR